MVSKIIEPYRSTELNSNIYDTGSKERKLLTVIILFVIDFSFFMDKVNSESVGFFVFNLILILIISKHLLS